MMDTVSHLTLIKINGFYRLRRHDIEFRGPPNSTFSYTEQTNGRTAVKQVKTDENGIAIIRGEPY